MATAGIDKLQYARSGRVPLILSDIDARSFINLPLPCLRSNNTSDVQEVLDLAALGCYQFHGRFDRL